MTQKIIEEAKKVIEQGFEEAKKRRNEEDRRDIIAGVGRDLVAILIPLLEKIALNSRLTKQEIEEIIKQIKVEPPQVNVNPPQIDIKAPDVNIPTIIFPKEEMIKAIRQAFVGIVIKPPSVEVKGAPINIPNKMEVKGIAGYFKGLAKTLTGKLNVGLEKIDRDNPLTVTLVDKKGNYYTAMGGGAVIAGGRGGGDSAPDILSDYNPSDFDEAGATKYYGYLRNDGYWYIRKSDATTHRYAKGDADYATNWTNRALTVGYDFFDQVF